MPSILRKLLNKNIIKLKRLSAKLLALSGNRNPYFGKLGVVEEGALADILLINGKQLAKFGRWFSPFETLKMATHDNAELLKMCGPRDPHQEGALGVIEEGAYADLILVNGNPLENLDLVADLDKNFAVIMKDGKIYKSTVR